MAIIRFPNAMTFVTEDNVTGSAAFSMFDGDPAIAYRVLGIWGNIQVFDSADWVVNITDDTEGILYGTYVCGGPPDGSPPVVIPVFIPYIPLTTSLGDGLEVHIDKVGAGGTLEIALTANLEFFIKQ